jgi:hypothetical protein
MCYANVSVVASNKCLIYMLGLAGSLVDIRQQRGSGHEMPEQPLNILAKS